MSAPSATTRHRLHSGAVLWALGAVGLAVVYRDVIADGVRLLRADAEESLGLFVPPIVVYLVWRRRARLLELPLRPSLVGATVFVAAVALTAVTDAMGFGTGARIGLWCAVGALTWTAWGGAALRCLALPFVFLFFGQPMSITLSDLITHPLRLHVTAHAASLLSLGGLPTVAEGVLLHMPAATLETTAACSGLRGFVAVLALALLLVELFPAPRLTTALTFPAALVVAYLLNVVRVMLEALWTTVRGTPSGDTVHTLLGLLTFAAVAWILTSWRLWTDTASA